MEMVTYVAGLFICLTYGFIIGQAHARRKITESLEKNGRCYVGKDLYHVTLVNGEMPREKS
jgi:uncharacterized protein YneF (UPF0154 family)